MFRIGEFSKIAQVSGRLLRYYDQIGLLTPEHVDPESGYRFYSAQQLPRLNRILALKELGLSLDQIARLLDDDISSDELRGMLALHKAQIEQELHEEMARLRIIESRIKQIDAGRDSDDYDVVVKSVPAQPVLTFRELCVNQQHTRALTATIITETQRKINPGLLGHLVGVVHSDMYEMENVDLEIGFLVTGPVPDAIQLDAGPVLTLGELPAVPHMVTVTRLGPPELGHGCTGAVGHWVEANGYRFDGPGREVFIQFPMPGHENDAVTEIQFPVTPISFP